MKTEKSRILTKTTWPEKARQLKSSKTRRSLSYSFVQEEHSKLVTETVGEVQGTETTAEEENGFGMKKAGTFQNIKNRIPEFHCLGNYAVNEQNVVTIDQNFTRLGAIFCQIQIFGIKETGCVE